MFLFPPNALVLLTVLTVVFLNVFIAMVLVQIDVKGGRERRSVGPMMTGRRGEEEEEGGMNKRRKERRMKGGGKRGKEEE